MKKTIDKFKEELSKLKLGRLTSDMFQNLKVKVYNEQQNLLDLCQALSRGPEIIVF